MKKNLGITIIVFFLSIQLLNAQSWQWGKNGGGTIVSGTPTGDNSILDIEHDKEGNLYVLGLVSRVTAHFMGDTFAINGINDMVLYKLDCNGNKVWKKQIGDMGGNDEDYKPKVDFDNNDNVYITGFALPSSTHGFRVDTDTTLLPAVGQYYRSYIVSYSKNGNYRFLKTYNTGAAAHFFIFSHACLAADNHLYVLAQLRGNFFGLSDTIHDQYFIFKYDTNAILQSYFQVGDSGVFYNNSQCITSDITGNIYLGGYTPPTVVPVHFLSIGGHYVRSAKSFLAKFDTSGTFKWITMNDDTFSSIVSYKFNKNLGVIASTGNGGGQFVPGDTGTRYGSIR